MITRFFERNFTPRNFKSPSNIPASGSGMHRIHSSISGSDIHSTVQSGEFTQSERKITQTRVTRRSFDFSSGTSPQEKFKESFQYSVYLPMRTQTCVLAEEYVEKKRKKKKKDLQSTRPSRSSAADAIE